MSQAEELFGLFNGLKRAFGTFKITGVNESKGKATGKALTVQDALTVEHWEKHITGQQGVGVVPINDDNCCGFAAIDIDVYDLDLNTLERKVDSLGLPLVVCRTKSGGAHLYMFLTEPVAAVLVREKLTSWAQALGYPGVEIFPKQDSLAGEHDVGNWINMPYFDTEYTTRYAIHEAKAIGLDEFIALAKAKRIAEAQLTEIHIEQETVVIEGAPPCLQTLALHGVPEGGRNNALYNFAVLARQVREGDDSWQDLLAEYNQQYMTPPLPFSEVGALIKGFGKKEYFYKCNEPPVNSCCNKDICRKCQYGIGGNGEDPGVQIDGLTKICTEPPVWILQVSGHRLQMETEEFLNQARFAKRCVEAINFYPVNLKPAKWKKLINDLLANVREIEAPSDAGARGQFLYHLEQFCTTRAEANNKDELLMGKPWHEDDRTYFRAADLIKYLEQQRFRDFKGNQIYAIMRGMLKDVSHHFFNLRGKGCNCWSVPSFAAQTEEHEVPTIEEEEF